MHRHKTWQLLGRFAAPCCYASPAHTGPDGWPAAGHTQTDTPKPTEGLPHYTHWRKNEKVNETWQSILNNDYKLQFILPPFIFVSCECLILQTILTLHNHAELLKWEMNCLTYFFITFIFLEGNCIPNYMCKKCNCKMRENAGRRVVKWANLARHSFIHAFSDSLFIRQ